MNSVLLITLSGKDRPGLVQALADCVAEHDANWEHSRMLHHFGHFVGMLQISVPALQAHPLITQLRQLGDLELTIAEGGPVKARAEREVQLKLIGADNPGIVAEIFAALASSGCNVEALTSDTQAAPDSGQALFRAEAVISVPRELELSQLRSELESIASDLMVDIELKG